MTKNKIVGIINFLIGIPQLLIPILLLVVTVPRLTRMYDEFGVARPNLTGTYIATSLVVMLAIANIFAGIKNISKPSGIVFTVGLVLAIIAFTFGGLLVGFISASLISPIYSLTSQS